MSLEAYITLAIIGISMFCFMKESIPVDLVALGIMVSLVITGVVDAGEAISGFANQATLAVAAMFILSRSLLKSNLIDFLGPFMEKMLNKTYSTSILSMAFMMGGISAFINNTPVVATFIPVVNRTTKKLKHPPSKYLIPLSYLAIFGGMCTLIGTSTNLLVSGMASDRGFEGFEMFTLAPVGLCLLIVGVIYVIFVGRYLLPDMGTKDLMEEEEEIKQFLAEVRIKEKSEEKELTLNNFIEENDIKIKILKRNGETEKDLDQSKELKEGDTLLIEGSLKEINKLIKEDYLSLAEDFEDKEFPDEETRMVEIILLPNSEIIGQKLEEVDFLNRYNANVIGIRQRGEKQLSDLKEVKLQAGDILVLLTNKNGYQLLEESQKKRNSPFISVSEKILSDLDPKKLYITISVILSVILLATFNILPLVISAFAGVVVLNIFGVITMQEAYRAVDWKVIFLLAGSMSLGAAMTSSGLSENISELLLNFTSQYQSQMLIVAIFYLFTALLTETMSNNASAALMVPIAFSVAGSLDTNILPLLVTIAIAGSASFMTPIGYQTNTMVFSAGKYKFTDFTKVGAPLSLTFLIVASILIPYFYPF
ncbi:TRAP transporter large permease subunit [Psychroflexus sp. YR1-1]|uniref:TRAP transporter large permease subunit n=1 Tax=Psychroflexus aurantiacus TaxID=2709310 RepID=A0A6B3QZF5_9FLAO|nr:SLC13 family permease [Psychroflexus aurantiacus]NEV93723.1 TRAP transporter large permease subunit [Psychroflexus aurantiacus]